MSSHKVTLKDLIEKWKELTSQSSTTRWDEMQAFFADASEAEIAPVELMRRKDEILRVWVPLTWAEAQKKNESWREKSWWSDRKRGTSRTFDKWYSEYARTWKAANQSEAEPPMAAPSTSESFSPTAAEEEYYGRFEIFTTHEQILAHRKKVDEREKGSST